MQSEHAAARALQADLSRARARDDLERQSQRTLMDAAVEQLDARERSARAQLEAAEAQGRADAQRADALRDALEERTQELRASAAVEEELRAALAAQVEANATQLRAVRDEAAAHGARQHAELTAALAALRASMALEAEAQLHAQLEMQRVQHNDALAAALSAAHAQAAATLELKLRAQRVALEAESEAPAAAERCASLETQLQAHRLAHAALVASARETEAAHARQLHTMSEGAAQLQRAHDVAAAQLRLAPAQQAAWRQRCEDLKQRLVERTEQLDALQRCVQLYAQATYERME